MKYTKEEILSKVDHTLLKPEATWPQIQALCDDAIKYHTASVCINTCYVKQAVQYMAGRVGVLRGRLPSGCNGYCFQVL